MTTIYTPQESGLILAAIESIQLGNNGYADIGANGRVADGVRSAGFTVIATRDLHGNPVFRGFTPAAQKALAVSPFGVSTYRPIERRDCFDYEGAILDRQERAGMHD